MLGVKVINIFLIFFTEDGSDLHKIPVQTVSANMAAWLMRHMRGEAAPQHWAGGLNVMYVLGLDTNGEYVFYLMMHSTDFIYSYMV